MEPRPIRRAVVLLLSTLLTALANGELFWGFFLRLFVCFFLILPRRSLAARCPLRHARAVVSSRPPRACTPQRRASPCRDSIKSDNRVVPCLFPPPPVIKRREESFALLFISAR